MRRKVLSLNYIIILMFCLVLAGFWCQKPVSAGVNDFYFSDFTGDYYLSKDEEGVSHLKVVESVTAVFPDFNQNKGICRQIPFTNQDGKNLTLSSLTRDNIKLTRNGEPEPIYSIEKEGNYYNVCAGTDDYVLGKQTYTFEYEYERVVTEFTEGDKTYQELYWDTNGNGATQRFDSVTARLHFADPSVYTGKKWCYVGKYGISGQDRCTITAIDDGVEFKAKILTAYENLTYDVELLAGSFTIPEPVKNYAYVYLTIAASLISLFFIVRFFIKYLKSREKANYYKGYFVKPEYQPHKEYSLAEMSEIYLGKKKDYKVAMLLEMIVNHQIELKKNDKKKWVINVVQSVNGEYADLLKILNGGTAAEVGDEIVVKRHTATSSLISTKRAIEAKIVGDLKNHGLVEKSYSFGGSGKRGLSNIIAMTIITAPIVIMFGLFLMGILSDFLKLDEAYGTEFVFYRYFYRTMLILIIATIVICTFLNDRAEKYNSHTKKGLEAVRYMDGLKLYIEMAEADRLKMLQSVKGADTSAKGIVKLYEKLLPYAAIFGLEESWMKEMKEYCELEEVAEPDYLMNGLAISEITRGLRSAATYATSSTTMSSSGGGSSSGFSGGGGGGFSGGGGGGGGFSGR